MTIKVYTKPDCVQCDMTKRLLDREGLAYETIDVTADDQAMAYVRELGYTSVPVVVAGDQHWAGFKVERVKGLKAKHE